jgi:hypothetical protein
VWIARCTSSGEAQPRWTRSCPSFAIPDDHLFPIADGPAAPPLGPDLEGDP